jgi:hypothetical protein
MRNRRTQRIGHAEADQLVTGDPGPEHAALRHLLDAARAPATAQELRGEKDVVAAFVAHRRRAVRAARKNRTPKVRTAAVPVTAALALLIFGGTAVAARTGYLPQEAQQHAHRLFSALGVPAPRTGATPSPSSSAHPPTTTPRPAITALSWCDAWPRGPLTKEDRRRLVAAAGSEEKVERYCAELRKSASPTPGASRSAPSTPGHPPITPPGRAKKGKPTSRAKPPVTPGPPQASTPTTHGNSASAPGHTKSHRP